MNSECERCQPTDLVAAAVVGMFLNLASPPALRAIELPEESLG